MTATNPGKFLIKNNRIQYGYDMYFAIDFFWEVYFFYYMVDVDVDCGPAVRR